MQKPRKVRIGIASVMASLGWLWAGLEKVMSVTDAAERWLPEWTTALLPWLIVGASLLWILLEYRSESKRKVREANEETADERSKREAAERERDLFRAQVNPAISAKQRGEQLLAEAKQLLGPNTPEFFYIGGYHAWLGDVAKWYTEATEWVQGFAPEALANFRDYPLIDVGPLPYWSPPKDISEQVYSTWRRLYTRTCVLHFVLTGGETTQKTADDEPSSEPSAASRPSSPDQSPPPNRPRS